jgi:Tol biopolymer transport system component
VSPDGKWIAFVSNREGQDRLFLVRPDGRGQRRLHTEAKEDTRWDAGEFEAGEADAVWTPDSKELVFSSRGPRGYWHLYSAVVETGALTQLTDGAWDDQLPALSPDGKWIAFVSSRDGNAEVYVMPRGGKAQRVTVDPAADWKPAWVPAR